MLNRPGTPPWIPFAVLAVTAAIYLPALTFGFVCDDVKQIVWSQPNFTWRAVPSYFTSDVWSYSARERTNYYRPIFMMWLMINSRLIGLNTALWHLSAILAHLAATLLLYFLARRLVGDPLVAGAAALLFGVHPAHVEAVAWISGATESLFAIFAFGTILCHIRWREESQSTLRLRWRIASMFLFAIAILSKETAVILPVLIAAYEWLFPPSSADGSAGRLRRVVSAPLPYAAIVLLYLPLRLYALGTLAPMTSNWSLAMLAGTWPSVLSFYLRQLLFPIQYSIFYPISPVRDPGLANFLIPLLVVGIAAAVLLWISRRSPVIAFSIVMLVVPILPVLNLRAFPFDDFLHDRYLYLALAGLSILLALGIQRVSRGRESVLIGILVAVTLALSLVTVGTSRYWRDDPALYTRGIEVAPESHIAQMNLGQALVREKRWVDALPFLKSAMAGYPLGESGYSLSNATAHCYLELGDYNQAASYLRDAIAMQPRYSEAYLNLGMLELHQGLLDDAEAKIRQALGLRERSDASPEFDRYHFSLGEVLERKGDLQGALAEYEAELRENPQAEDVRDRMLALQARLRTHPR